MKGGKEAKDGRGKGGWVGGRVVDETGKEMETDCDEM